MESANTVNKKKIPMRQCMGCNEHFPKNRLVRVLRDPDGHVCIDRTGKQSGRGAYVCSPECLVRLRKSKRLDRVLEITVSDEIFAGLEQEFAHDATTAND